MKKILFLSSIFLSSPILAVVSCNNKNKSSNNSSEPTQESKIEVTKIISYDGIINANQLADKEYLQNANFVSKAQLELMNDSNMKEFIEKNNNKVIDIEIKWICKSGTFDEILELTQKLLASTPTTLTIKANDTQSYKMAYNKINTDENFQKMTKYFASSEKASVEFNFVLTAK